MPRTPSIIQFTETGAKAFELRQRAIASNLSNVRKPGFLRHDVRFEELLAEQLRGGIENVRLDKIQPKVFKPLNTPLSPDGNDIHLDMETTNLMKNSGRYKAMMRIMKKAYLQHELAMKTEG
jgi:flagellar basal-body rod protein FlgB